MQQGFDFLSGDLARWQGVLAPDVAVILPAARRTPIGQLVKSLISGRTRDAVSLAAYHRLGRHFGSAPAIAAATPATVEPVIAEVTFAKAKAEWLVATLGMIAAERGSFDLAFLAGVPLDTALAWLERLPGVGRKVAASTLNASSLARPVMIVDSHVLRVLHRLRFVPTTADGRATSQAVTAAMPGWDADRFLALHIALKRLGQDRCRFEEPICGACPLSGDCPSRRD
ncbi:endonuclease III domain-containing protein [uncultured Sphingomonas sp.]|uniref:endonuclease III domain-containing protein n=1 Tax=uncultured Sphingomonas sp. TaxID=158754 RepID=UPI0035CB31A1